MATELPSATQLIDAFLKDLQNIVQLFGAQGGTEPKARIDRHVYMYYVSNQQSWQADRDVIVRSVVQSTGGAHVLSTNKSYNTSNVGQEGVKLDVISFSQGTALPVFLNLGIKVKKGESIYYVAGSGLGVTIGLENA